MSSEIYELMKRSDEGAVVEKAHRRPRFVEDCVREMIRGVVEGLPELRDDAFVSARQENLETIHQHNVVADRYGLLGELRHELALGRALSACTSPCATGSTGAAPTPSVAPALATTTIAIAATSRAPRSWSSTTQPASAATAGSSDISTPKTAAGSRRSASSSSE